MAAAVGPTPYSASNNTAPAMDSFEITPSNTVYLPVMARALYVGVGGNVVVITPASTSVTFVSVPSGKILPVMAIRINSTNTTATNIVGLV